MSTSETKVMTDSIQRIGEYEIIRKIGTGGIAEIFLARQPSLDRAVAVKVLSSRLSDDEEIRRRFDREALTIARLNHPNIIHVIDRGTSNGKYYFVMEFIDGDDLKVLAKREKFTVQEKCALIVQCLKALDYAHKNGVIHRDMKPANILVDKDHHAHVADFGIAQLIDPNYAETTSTSVIMGTPAYMSPEQKISTSQVDQTTDIYSMGVVLYEFLTGDRPLGHFRPASTYSDDIPVELDSVICRALAQHPEDRFQTAVEFKDAILASLSRSGEVKIPAGNTTIVREASKIMGKCTFLDTIKEHSYGATYLVEDRETHELFVIKKITKREAGLKEARLLARLKHKNIVNIYGAGEDADKAVVLMQYARGGSLSDRLVRRMPWFEVMKIMRGCLDGLDFAHKNHLIHGNLRPSNILIGKDGEPWLTDFGLPEHYGGNRGNWYGAPEGKRSIQADLYTLGVVMYQCLTNQLPLFDRQGRLSFAGALEDAHPGFEKVMMRLLQRNPVMRYSSCSVVIEDLEDILVDDTSISSPAAQKKSRSWPSVKMGWNDWLIGFMSGIIAVFLITYLLGWLDVLIQSP